MKGIRKIAGLLLILAVCLGIGLAAAEAANFPYISCNFRKEGKLVFDPYIIKEFEGGEDRLCRCVDAGNTGVFHAAVFPG